MRIRHQVITNTVLLLCTIFISCDTVESDYESPYESPDNKIHSIIIESGEHNLISLGYLPEIIFDRIIFIDNHNLNLSKIDGTDQQRITTINSIGYYDISPNNMKIVLSTGYDLYILNYDGSNFHRVTDTENIDLEPTFSMNSEEIIFRRNWNICSIDINGSNFKTIVEHPDSSYFRFPYYLYDDRMILYTEETKNAKFFMHLYDLEKKTDTVLTNLSRTILDISIDSEILFRSDSEDGNYFIRKMDIVNKQNIEIGEGQYASFSKDGSKIIYSNGEQIYIADKNGTNQKLIYSENDETKWISRPKISSDNNYVVYESSK